MTTNTRVRDWDPSSGDALQGDVIMFEIPHDIKIVRTDEILPRDGRLVLAEGEITGHHHAIWMRNPATSFHDAALARSLENAASAPAGQQARLYRDPAAVDELVKRGFLTTNRLAIGFLVVENAPETVTHDEHDGIRIIRPAVVYVGGQQEWDAGEARRVAD